MIFSIYGKILESTEVSRMMLVKYFQFLSYAYFVACHNILRTPTLRLARFELRHVDRVQSKPHFLEYKVKSIESCVNVCTAKPQCKSVNFFSNSSDAEILDICQLVGDDVTDNNDYIARPGWKHYDTGRTKVTRLRQKTTGECYVPANQGCGLSGEYQMHLVSPSDTRCNDVDAYFEYDRDTGRISQYCTGREVCPDGYEDKKNLKYKYDCSDFYKNAEEKLWKVIYRKYFFI